MHKKEERSWALGKKQKGQLDMNADVFKNDVLIKGREN